MQVTSGALLGNDPCAHVALLEQAWVHDAACLLLRVSACACLPACCVQAAFLGEYKSVQYYALYAGE